MPQINLLSQNTIDQIAAGEVVERPLSVVKELTENAIDAGADAIAVEIKEGGISLIRVTDNGCGIEKDQVQKAFLRHATSKITTIDDLSHTQSLGFRGEALSSIAAVSQVELLTKTKEDTFGTRYRINGGKEVDLEETLKELLDYACEQGVTQDSIGYRDLFDTKLMDCLMPRPSEVSARFLGDL